MLVVYVHRVYLKMLKSFFGWKHEEKKSKEHSSVYIWWINGMFLSIKSEMLIGISKFLKSTSYYFEIVLFNLFYLFDLF